MFCWYFAIVKRLKLKFQFVILARNASSSQTMYSQEGGDRLKYLKFCTQAMLKKCPRVIRRELLVHDKMAQIVRIQRVARHLHHLHAWPRVAFKVAGRGCRRCQQSAPQCQAINPRKTDLQRYVKRLVQWPRKHDKQISFGLIKMVMTKVLCDKKIKVT